MPRNKTQKNIPEGWKFNSVGNVLDYEQPTPYLVRSTNYDNNYSTPVLTAGKTFVLGYTDEKNGIFINTPVIIFDDFTTAIQFVDFDFKVKSSAMKILKNKPDIVDLKFVYGWMQIHPFKVGEHKRNYLSEYQYQDILLPPLPEQKRIVGVLGVWDECLEVLAEKIEVKKKIKKGLMQNFLTGKKRLKGFTGEWGGVKLGEICDIKKGEQLNRSELTEIGKYSALNGGMNPSGYTDKWNTEGDTITISEGGNSCGYVNFNTKRFWCGGHCYALKNIRAELITDFIYQLLKKMENRIMSFRVGSGLPNIQKRDLESFKITIPKLAEQQAIAKILTTADGEIEELEKKRGVIEEQKRFLLNNLITGKIRVPEFAK